MINGNPSKRIRVRTVLKDEPTVAMMPSWLICIGWVISMIIQLRKRAIAVSTRFSAYSWINSCTGLAPNTFFIPSSRPRLMITTELIWIKLNKPINNNSMATNDSIFRLSAFPCRKVSCPLSMALSIYSLSSGMTWKKKLLLPALWKSVLSFSLICLASTPGKARATLK